MITVTQNAVDAVSAECAVATGRAGEARIARAIVPRRIAYPSRRALTYGRDVAAFGIRVPVFTRGPSVVAHIHEAIRDCNLWRHLIRVNKTGRVELDCQCVWTICVALSKIGLICRRDGKDNSVVVYNSHPAFHDDNKAEIQVTDQRDLRQRRVDEASASDRRQSAPDAAAAGG